MVVMAIIAVLAVLFIGAITVARNSAKETTNRTNAKTLQIGLEAKFTTNQAYPVGSPTAAMSFTAAKAAGIANVELSNPPVCPTPYTGFDGGGVAYINNTAFTLTNLGPTGNQKTYTGVNYVIIPANAGCTDLNYGTGHANVIKGP